MTVRLRSILIDLLCRTAGAALLATACALMRLFAAVMYAHPHREVQPLPLLTAAVAIACASGGLTLLTLGRHILAPVRISQRWTPTSPSHAD